MDYQSDAPYHNSGKHFIFGSMVRISNCGLDATLSSIDNMTRNCGTFFWITWTTKTNHKDENGKHHVSGYENIMYKTGLNTSVYGNFTHTHRTIFKFSVQLFTKNGILNTTLDQAERICLFSWGIEKNTLETDLHLNLHLKMIFKEILYWTENLIPYPKGSQRKSKCQ